MIHTPLHYPQKCCSIQTVKLLSYLTPLRNPKAFLKQVRPPNPVPTMLIPLAAVIDLCTIEGVVKELYKHRKANAVRFFKLRELCLVVSIQSNKLFHFGPLVSLVFY